MKIIMHPDFMLLHTLTQYGNAATDGCPVQMFQQSFVFYKINKIGLLCALWTDYTISLITEA